MSNVILAKECHILQNYNPMLSDVIKIIITIIRCYPIFNSLKEKIMICKIEATLNNTSGNIFEWIFFRRIAKRP